MTNMTATNPLLYKNSVISDAEYQDDILVLAEARTVASDTILCRTTSTGKLGLYVPGGSASVTTDAAPFNFSAGDTLVLDVNNVGNATCTWAATQASITDTTSYPVADQDTKTLTVTLSGGAFDGEAQAVAFNTTVTTAAGIVAQLNSQLKGCSASVVGGQAVITHDGYGEDMAIAITAGTSDLTWDTAVDGTGDVADIDAVTATELKTIIEADSTATATVNADNTVTITATEELQVVSGNVVAKTGLTAATYVNDGNDVPVSVLPYELAGVQGDNAVRVLIAGKCFKDRLVVDNGATITNAIKDDLRRMSIFAIDSTDLSVLDNQ